MEHPNLDKTKIAVAIFNKLANEYQNKFMDVSWYGNSFDIFCDNIKNKNASILEIACGPGNITQYLLQKRPDFKISGIDLAPNMVALATINNPAATFQIMDCREIGNIDNKYDAIMCGFCLPYLNKEEAIQLIFDASKLLKSQGLLYLSTMEDDYNQSGFRKGSNGDEIYMHFHEAEYLIKALNENHFKVVYLERKDYPTTNQENSPTIDLIIIGEKLSYDTNHC